MGNSNGTFDKNGRIGFRVIEVEAQSPGQRSGLVAYSDFIVSVNGYPLHTMTKDAIEYLVKRSENITLQVQVYNINAGSTRQVDITPSRDWPGDGLLGIVIRLESFAADKDSDIPKEHADIDVSFDSIYKDFEAIPRDRSDSSSNSPKNRSGSQIFSRKSFTNGDSPKTTMTNYLSHSNTVDDAEKEGEISPSRRGSTSSKILKVFTFSPKAKEGSSSTADNTPSSPEDIGYENSERSSRVTFSPDDESNGKQTPRRKSSKGSGVFRKFSFTS